LDLGACSNAATTGGLAAQAGRGRTRAKRAPLPEGIMDIDESGIGGSSTEQENAYTSAYFWSTRRTRQRYQETTSTLTVAFEPAPSWDTVKQKNRRKKA
jgi:hypothetical protein